VATSSLAQRASTPRGKGRHLDWPACQNARDLGGLLTAEGRRVRWGALVRAEVYRVIVDRYAAGFAAAARAVARARPGGVIVHCHAGKDRTGILVALVLELLGVPRTTIARDYALTDRRLVQHYAAELSELAHDPVRRERLRMFQHTRTSTMRALLDHVAARHGGAAAYLCSGGLGHADTERLRARLLA
jgi:protein-tyrosine phosphatase